MKIGYAIPTHHCVCMGHRYGPCSESCVQMSVQCNCYLMRTSDKYFSQKNPRNVLRQDCSVMIRKSSEVHASFIRKWFGQNLQNFQESFSTCSKNLRKFIRHFLINCPSLHSKYQKNENTIRKSQGSFNTRTCRKF